MSKNSENNYPRIGSLALKHGLIREEDLQKAMDACAGEKNLEKALKAYFLENSLLSEKNINRLHAASRAITIRQNDIKFGTIAIQNGFVTQTLLELALQEQRTRLEKEKKAVLVSDLLVEAGIMSESQRDIVLKEQKRLKKIIAKKNSPVAEKETRPGPEPEERIPKNKKMMEITIMGIKLTIPEDASAAYISKTDQFSDALTVKDIKQILNYQNIVYGIVEDRLINGFIRSSGFKEKPFRVAKGILPREGKDAEIKLFFDTDHLKAGRINGQGKIDFKERGKIPRIEQGFILGEKLPLKEEQTGKNIFGEVTSVDPARDIKLKYGKGTRLSDDNLKVIAAVSGQPKYSWSGIFSVFDELVTKGDVNYETGHIDYQGNVKVKGIIKSGFNVNANTIRAEAIDGGIIHAEENLNISEGINEAVIFAKGSIQAKYIHKSKILCMGAISCDKEIVESKIETSSTCDINKGKILHSEITAKMGVFAKTIGSKLSSPCTIKVGTDVFVVKQLKKLKTSMSRIREDITRYREKLKALEEKSSIEQSQSSKTAHLQDRSQVNQKKIISKIAGLDKVSDIEKIKELKARLQNLKTAAKKAEQDLQNSFDIIDGLNQEISQTKETIGNKLEQLEEMRQERDTIAQIAKDTPGKAVVKVYGTLMEGTIVFGRHSQARIDRVHKNAKISEIKRQYHESNNQTYWGIIISPQ
ncbi:MAG: FapA family protein [Thermodesulfobacteriota bacterium]|nr:FapA family protein [Thermodesulfobacteriota bacterium]